MTANAEDRTQYPSPTGRDDAPTPWDARWSAAHTAPVLGSVVRGFLALVLAVGLVLALSLVLDGAALGLVAALIMLVALGLLRT
jgi:hypothetical protein